jgi:hypothetical protein
MSRTVQAFPGVIGDWVKSAGVDIGIQKGLDTLAGHGSGRYFQKTVSSSFLGSMYYSDFYNGTNCNRGGEGWPVSSPASPLLPRSIDACSRGKTRH